jgi:hypothetical protein
MLGKYPDFIKDPESQKAFDEAVERYVAWWKGEERPETTELKFNKHIWFITFDDKEMERKYGPCKGTFKFE